MNMLVLAIIIISVVGLMFMAGSRLVKNSYDGSPSENTLADFANFLRQNNVKLAEDKIKEIIEDYKSSENYFYSLFEGTSQEIRTQQELFMEKEGYKDIYTKIGEMEPTFTAKKILDNVFSPFFTSNILKMENAVNKKVADYFFLTKMPIQFTSNCYCHIKEKFVSETTGISIVKFDLYLME